MVLLDHFIFRHFSQSQILWKLIETNELLNMEAHRDALILVPVYFMSRIIYLYTDLVFTIIILAEKFLESVEVNQNYPLLLLNLMENAIDTNIRLSAAITFKNYVKRNWKQVSSCTLCCTHLILWFYNKFIISWIGLGIIDNNYLLKFGFYLQELSVFFTILLITELLKYRICE